MKQHIDTIPVWEAYQADCECPLCRIRLKNEAMYVTTSWARRLWSRRPASR